MRPAVSPASFQALVRRGILLTAFAAAHAAAQCQPQWFATEAESGIAGAVHVIHVHPGGDIYIGGTFQQVAGITVNRIARWNGQAWTGFGTGLIGSFAAVEAIAFLPSGDMVVAGRFTSAGGVPAVNIARWDGTAWWPLGAGLTGASSGNQPHAFSLAVLPNGDLIAGGEFRTAGQAAAMRIARWNGQEWSPMGSGLGVDPVYSPVYTLKQLPTGEFYAGGQFHLTGSTAIARWSGTDWVGVGGGMINNPGVSIVRSLHILPDGSLLAGGRFAIAGSLFSRSIVRWDGAAWSGYGPGIGTQHSDEVFAVTRLPNGDIIAAGNFSSAGGIAVDNIARWDGASWSALGPGAGHYIRALALHPSGDLLVGGSFPAANGLPGYLRRWGCPPVPCYANCDNSTEPPVLNVADFGCFLQKYAAGETYANCDNSTEPPVLNVADFGCFLQKYAAGCP